MARTKNEALTIRTTAEVKTLLKLAAERERRSAAPMVEVLVLEYAHTHGLAVAEQRGAKGMASAQIPTADNGENRG